jgi:hypothetical protein
MNAVNGAESAGDMLPPIPLSRPELLARLKACLSLEALTLVAAEEPGPSALAEPVITIYLVELRDNGRVREVQLEQLAIQKGVLDPRVESVVAHW